MTVEVSVVGLALDGQPASSYSVAQKTERRWHVQLRDGSTVEHVIQRLGLPDPEIEFVLVNGRHADRMTVLNDGDAVAFTGQVSGD